MKQTKHLALASILAAIGVISLISTIYFPAFRSYLMWLTGAVVFLTKNETSSKYGVLSIAAVSFLTFALTGSFITVFSFVLYYGPYALVKREFEKCQVKWMRYAFKTFFFLITNAAISYLGFIFFGFSIQNNFLLNHPQLFLPYFIIVFSVYGFCYDAILSWSGGIFHHRIKKNLT